MKLSEISIRRPVLASMMSAALVLFGVIGYTRLSVRELPDIDPPIISVTTVLPGANAQVVETAVTDVLEEELSTIQGLRTLSSGSAEQTSNITLEFTLDRPVDVAAQDVRDKVSRVRGRLPEAVLEPVIEKQSADAQPFFWLALSSDNYDLMQLSDVADRLVKARLQSLPGVGSAGIFGERRYSMRVWVQPAALSARGLTVQDVEGAILSHNVEIPAGRIESTRREFSVRSLGELKTPQEFGELGVASQGTQVVKLKDVARVELAPEDTRSIFRWNGSPSVAIGVVRQSKANLIEVARNIREALPSIQQTLPLGVKLEIAFDGSVFVRHSINDARLTLLIAAILVVLIIFVFLRNLRATIIPGLAIPASIVATFAVMYFLGYSINNFTLLALTIAIGIVVDDAIIVLENAYRHQEELHEGPEQAAVNGTNEIAFAVIATTIALVAVFTPLGFLRGSTGRLLSEFGIAVAGAVVISGFVALTLTPMLSAKILRVPKEHGELFKMFERGFNALANRYARLLERAVTHPRAVTVGTVAVVAVSFFALLSYRPTRLKEELIPDDDRGFFLIIATAPEGASLDYTDGYVRRIEQILSKTPDISGYFTIVGGFAGGVNSAFVGVIMKDWSERHTTVQQTVGALFPQVYFGIAGVEAFPYAPGALGFSQPIQYVVQNPDFATLSQVMDQFTNRAKQINGLVNVDTDLRVNKPELRVTFDRDRAEDLGVPVRDVAAALQTFLGGRRISTFTRNDKLYYVMVQLDPQDRATPSDMRGIYLRGKGEQLVQLAALANVDEGVGPRQINHFNRVPSFTLSASLVPPFSQGDALDSLDAVAREVLPPGSTTALAGDSREFRESGGALYFAFTVALLVVFMVLASQFESLAHPFTVLLSVPLAITGALATLKVAALLGKSGGTINLYSQIGMILLIGLVTKNSILLVEYANQLKAKGLDTIAAVLESGRIRLRPILMTSVSTIMGAIPIAWGVGAGSASRKPLGYAIVGGVFFSTALTLFVVPVAYVMLDALMERLRARRGRLVPVAGEGD
ncbi:MAG TPA: efflux RND transporter permease subunit [Gemmatimonadales bacterium]|jgi:multidrug efflux pump|nr:efflux RND transporter permease subunit [Gemmatimonadales bacterium]